MRKRSLLFRVFVARTGEQCLPQRAMFGDLVGGNDYSGAQEKERMMHLKVDTLAVGIMFEVVAKCCTEGRQIDGSDPSRTEAVIHAEMA